MYDSGFTLPGGHVVAMSHGVVLLIEMIVFLVKVFLMCSFQILIRWRTGLDSVTTRRRGSRGGLHVPAPR